MDPEQNLQLLREFPLLIPQNKECTTFDGFLSVRGEEFRVYIDLKEPPTVKSVIFLCCLPLRYFLASYKNIIREWQVYGISLLEFLMRLRNLVAVGIQHGKFSMDVNASCMNNLVETIEFYTWVIEEVLHSEYKEGISLDTTFEGELNEIQLRFLKKDAVERTHTALLKFQYETQIPTISADLPSQVEWEIQKGMTISRIYDNFIEKVDVLQEFWNVMDCIDHRCWVIDPEQPKRKDTFRRIAIGKNLSLYININPFDLNKRPDITFIGSERTILPLRNSLEENLEFWNDLGNDIVEKLAKSLGIDEFPQKPSHEREEENGEVEQGECSICLSFRLDGDGELPSEVCNNAFCALPFHSSCLLMWLQSLANSHQNFDRLYGECPNCNSAISCLLTNER